VGFITFSLSGKYLAVRLLTKTIYFWISRNGTDLGYTAREFRLQGSGDINEVVWNFNLDLAAGEYVEMKWS
jgi:hypothetical protein